MTIVVEDESKSVDELSFGDVIACRYRVVCCHREHPLGKLYRCVDQTSGKAVMLQRLRKEFSGAQIQDRLFETRGSATLDHAAIDDLLDYGEDIDKRLFLVSEWRNSPSLAQLPLPLGFHEALGLIELVATALAPVHALGLVHGGIEPNNLLVDGEEDDQLRCCLLDFGLIPALEAGAEKSRALPLLIAPAYASPELISGRALDPAADVYALGVLMWELLFGAPPFRGPTLKILDAHLNRALPQIEATFDMPESFVAVLRGMLAKQAGDRYADANELLEQLRPYAQLGQGTSDSALIELAKLDANEVVEDQDDETVVFERPGLDRGAVVPAPLFHLSPEPEPRAQDGLPCEAPVTVVSVAPVHTGRRRRGLWLGGAALLSCLAVFALVGLAREPASLASLEPTTSAQEQAVASVTAPDRAAQVTGVPLDTPAPVNTAAGPVRLPDLDVAEGPGRIGASKFRAKKKQLYRRVLGRCVDGKVRRTVKLAVRVGESGAVEAATAMGGMGKTRLGRCAASQAQGLSFPASTAGGFYVYTLRLR